VRASNDAGYSGYTTIAGATTDAEIVETTVFASVDNLLMISSVDSSRANTVYSGNDLAVGCNWVYSSITGTQDFVCTSSLIWFDIDSVIGGRTIHEAKLRLSIYVLPADLGTQYALWAVYSGWNTATVTWNSMPSAYVGSERRMSPPVTGALPIEIDVTDIVQNWASGAWNNRGFLFEDTNFTFPYATVLRSTGLCSIEYYADCGGAAARPRLHLVYE